MIEKLLNQSIKNLGQEVSFVLGHKILAKSYGQKGSDWNELKGDALSLEEWEDLKELCLQSNEKLVLETKGFVAGIFFSAVEKRHWRFTFIEKKDCFRAYLSLLDSLLDSIEKRDSVSIDNPYFWDVIKRDQGIFIVSGERRQGKSSLMGEIILNDLKDKLRLTGLHVLQNQQHWPNSDSIVHLGTDTIEFDGQHLIYDGLERLVVDFNSIIDWKKWIFFSEQGQSVLLSLSGDSVTTLLQRLVSELPWSIFERVIYSLNGIVVQKFVGEQKIPTHEILILKNSQRQRLLSDYADKKSFFQIPLDQYGAENYQSLNQSLIQKLVRRKIDVKSAFSASLDPDQLDIQLKKLGL